MYRIPVALSALASLIGATFASGAQSTSVGPGTYLVGVDVSSGMYRSSPTGTSCYWERLSGLGGTLDDVIANDAVSDGPIIVEIDASDYAFRSRGCTEWKRIGRADSTGRYQEPIGTSPARADSAETQDGQDSPAAVVDVEPLTAQETTVEEARMRVAGDITAEGWLKAVCFKKNSKVLRDYNRAVVDGFLIVALSRGIARSWKQLSCEKRRLGLDVLFQIWQRTVPAMRKVSEQRTS